MAAQVPSEADKEGFGTACGRGVYTTRSFQKAMIFATTHVLGDNADQKELLDLAAVRVVLLVAIPGVHAALQGRWEHDPDAKKGEKYKIAPLIGDAETLRSTQQRGKLAETTGCFRHWTIWNEEEEEEETSSIAYVVGFFVLLTDWRLMAKSQTRGKNQDPKRGFIGWDVALEPPPGRPRHGEPPRSRSRSQARSNRGRASEKAKGKGKGGAWTGQGLQHQEQRLCVSVLIYFFVISCILPACVPATIVIVAQAHPPPGCEQAWGQHCTQ